MKKIAAAGTVLATITLGSLGVMGSAQAATPSPDPVVTATAPSEPSTTAPSTPESTAPVVYPPTETPSNDVSPPKSTDVDSNDVDSSDVDSSDVDSNAASSLPNTGGPDGLLLGGAAALLLAGGTAVVVARRRQTD